MKLKTTAAIAVFLTFAMALALQAEPLSYLRPLSLLDRTPQEDPKIELARLQKEKEGLQEAIATAESALLMAGADVAVATRDHEAALKQLETKMGPQIQAEKELAMVEQNISLTQKTPEINAALKRQRDTLREQITKMPLIYQRYKEAEEAARVKRARAVEERDNKQRLLGTNRLELRFLDEQIQRLQQRLMASQPAVSKPATPLFDEGNIVRHSDFDGADGAPLTGRRVRPGDTLLIPAAYVRKDVRKVPGIPKEGDVPLVVNEVMPEKDDCNLVRFNIKGLVVKAVLPELDLTATAAGTLVRWPVDEHGFQADKQTGRYAYGVYEGPGETRHHDGKMTPVAKVKVQSGQVTVTRSLVVPPGKGLVRLAWPDIEPSADLDNVLKTAAATAAAV